MLACGMRGFGPVGRGAIVTDVVYYIGGDRIDWRNGRLGDADKISWCDPSNDYECIIMRKTRGGYLSGYVAVPV